MKLFNFFKGKKTQPEETSQETRPEETSQDTQPEETSQETQPEETSQAVQPEPTKIIPTISSGVSGPLGVLHMPRFWQKVSLDAVGKLHPEYPACGAGYDQMMLDGIGLDKDATLAYIKDNLPTYVQFEAWVKNNASNLGGGADFNAAVEGYNHDDATRESILSAVGLPGADIKDAVNLNNLEDWHDFHGSIYS